MASIEDLFYRITPHLKGSKGTFDDTFMDDSVTCRILNSNVIVQEKIDGFNLGVTFDKYGNIIFIQKDKIVTPNSNLIAPVVDWCISNIIRLFNIIENKYVLYGELIHGEKKSIKNWIIMDAIEIQTLKFISYSRLLELIEPLSLNHIEIIYKGQLNSLEFVTSLIQKSNYQNEKMEGVCIRLEEENYTLEKYKFVREDFNKR